MEEEEEEEEGEVQTRLCRGNLQTTRLWSLDLMMVRRHQIMLFLFYCYYASVICCSFLLCMCIVHL